VKTGKRCPEHVALDSYSYLYYRLFGICGVELLNLGGIVDFGHQIRKACKQRRLYNGIRKERLEARDVDRDRREGN
jgi:hypothetical protein